MSGLTSRLILAVIFATALLPSAQSELSDDSTAPRTSPPTLFIIGDSTVNNHTKGLLGWGDPLIASFDATKIRVENRARGGRSSRTFQSEGIWDQVLSTIKPGDFVLIQFGHNDGGSLTQGRARASLKGTGEETQKIVVEATGTKEVVHTYGWYVRKYVADSKAKGATPIVFSQVPRNMWKADGTVARAANDYGKWASESAKQAGALFIDLNDLVAKRYEAAGPEKVKAQYFGEDHTHTTPAGAALTASVVAEAIRGLRDCPLRGYLLRAADAPLNEAAPVSLYRFDFTPGKGERGYTQVPSSAVYTKELGYGFEPGSNIVTVERASENGLRDGFCTSDKPFLFSVDVPEGNYNVTLTLGDPAGESTTTVKAESRRLLLENVHTAPGAFATRAFTVNVRNSKLPAGGTVALKGRERGVLHWDDKLTLEFNDARPCLCTLEISRADDAVTVYLAGDSTVTDQTREPWNSWGQMLPRFLKPGVAVANQAESGESPRSFISENRLEKILSTIRSGDYLFIQFGHNDQKERGEGVGAFTTYTESLKRFITEARNRGALPVLVTPVSRRTFDSDGKVSNSLGDYPEAVRQVAREESVPLIDLNSMSKSLYEALGAENSRKAFVDNTHHNNYGSYELARCVVLGIKQNRLGLSEFLVDDLQQFDPAHPDPVEQFKLPASPQFTTTVPEGS